MKKRILALLLVVCLSAGLLSTTVFASALFTPSSAFELIARANYLEQYGCTHSGCHHDTCSTPGCKYPACVDHNCKKPNGHIIHFVTNGGTVLAPVTIYEGQYFTVGTYVPVKVGHTFGGWYYDSGCTKPVHNFKPSCDTVLYAKWLSDVDPVIGGLLPFMDIPVNSYYYPAVSWANGCGVAASAKYFNPDSACSRADMLTFLWRAAGSPKSNLTYMPFTDVSESAYYCEAVQWALETGITKGTNNLKFRPNETVTRAEVVTMLYRYSGVTTAAANPYTDVTADDWFYDAVRWADGYGITNGTNNLMFRPYDNCSRSQVLTFLYRCFG